MKILKKILPGFLQQIDHKLLINAPWLWQVKIHYHIWILLLVNLLLAAIAWVWPLHFDRIPDLELLFALLFILQATYFCFWVYRMLRFNSDKNFGRWKFYHAQIQFLLWFISIFLIISLSFTPTMIMSYRVSHLISDEDFQNDLNTLEMGQPFEMDELNDYEYFFSKEDFVRRAQRKIDIDNDTNYRAINYPEFPSSLELLIAEAQEREDEFRVVIDGRMDTMMFRDSILHYRNLWQSLERDHSKYFNSFYPYHYSEERFPKLLDSQGLLDSYVKALGEPVSYAQRKLLARIEVAQKYGRSYRWDPQVYADYYAYFHGKYISKSNPKATWMFPAESTNFSNSSAPSFGTNISRIVDAKMKYHYFFKSGYWWMMTVVVFCITGLLFLFTSFRWQNFLAAVATGIVISIFMGLSLAFVEYYNEENLLAMEFFGLFWLLLGVAFLLGVSRVHSHIASTLWILLIAAMPFIPAVGFHILDRQFDYFDRDQYDVQIDALRLKYQSDEISYEDFEAERKRLDKLDDELRAQIVGYLVMCIVGGILFFYLVLVPLVKGRANRMLAYPKRS
ncbi:hypothetical protein KFE98_18685 [bacterium SCSIO 12741]|nr:hypothetical protein KFE98_18685 [bacterium SCSIO 12741]